ncbi:thioredoxin family protein [Spirosoma sp.]|uniref:thioredoxin family protein n=1 Tax=Spirosoma sp. TaxID=1899569 RepID=UPI003B3B2EB0
MRPICFLFVALLFCGFRSEEPSGIRFFSGSWQEVLLEAKRQNKPIYVDFYTNWCPPCRRMAFEAFPNVAIGAKFNERFVNYQVNAEIGEGVTLAKRYAVQSYPTALYLLPTGEVVHKAVGYAGVNAMLQQADMVFSMREVRRSRRKRMPSDDAMLSATPKPVDSTKADSLK